MAQQLADIALLSLRGGMNDTDPANALRPDQCTFANNVEWFVSTLGERRNGTEPLDITGSTLSSEEMIVHLSQWFPGNKVTEAEFWAIGYTPATSATFARRSTVGVWTPVVPIDPILLDEPEIFEVVTQPLNNKLFFAYKSAVDRLHVWDGTTLRPTGLSEPAAPVVITEGVGTYSGTRYFRVRYTTMSGSVVLARSEPSDSTTFIPPGTGAGANIARPALLGEGETNWEVEASDDNADFYRIATLLIATTSYNDEVADPADYADLGPLSEPIGANGLQPSARFLTFDGDRLILGGHWTDVSLQSTVWWTPTGNAPGVGNDERLDETTNSSLNLDNYAGGALTGLAPGISGSWYAFKWNHIYKMVRTGDDDRAYSAMTVSTSRGAISGTIFPGMDENGAACIYFLDPTAGPSRLGPGGPEKIVGLRKTWKRVNLNATRIIGRGCYYPYKQQAHWWISVDERNSPNLKLMLQVSEVQVIEAGGVGRGWALADGNIANIFSCTTFTEQIITDGLLAPTERPFIGQADPDFIQRCDVQTDDNGHDYIATMRSAPMFTAGLLNKFGAMVGALLAFANNSTSVVVRLIMNFGLNDKSVTVSLAPEALEEYVIKPLDNLSLSECRALQVEFSDE